MSGPGRPRSSSAREAILDAVVDLIAEHGATSTVSMDSVAARSGASKATIYRHWSSKEEVIAAAVGCIKPPPECVLPHVSVRDDLIRFGRSFRSGLSDRELRVIRSIALEVPSNADLRKHRRRFMALRREAGRALFRYWVNAGELREDLDVDVAAAMFVGPLLMVTVYQHELGLNRRRLVERLADHVLQGIRARRT
jgi:AcrR family transcriptional regulator